MFKIEKDPQFTHEVKVMTPVDGGHQADTFKATFRLLPADKVEKHNLVGGGQGTVEFLKEAVIGLDGIMDDEEKPIPFSDALRDKVLAIYGARLALFDTYIRAVTKAAAGN